MMLIPIAREAVGRGAVLWLSLATWAMVLSPWWL